MRINNENLDDKQKICPSVELWCAFLGITRATLSEYRRTRSGAWADFIDYVKGLIASCKLSAAEHYKTPPAITIFDMQNNYGYRNFVSVQYTEEKTDNKRALGVNELPDLSNYTGIEDEKQTVKDDDLLI